MNELQLVRHRIACNTPHPTTVRCPNFDCRHIFKAIAHTNVENWRDACCPACGQRVSGGDLMWGMYSPSRESMDIDSYRLLIRTLVCALVQAGTWGDVALAPHVKESLERACGEWPEVEQRRAELKAQGEKPC